MEGSGQKLGHQGGEGVRGDNGLNFRLAGTHGYDGWELSSPGSSPLCPSCVFGDSNGRETPSGMVSGKFGPASDYMHGCVLCVHVTSLFGGRGGSQYCL